MSFMEKSHCSSITVRDTDNLHFSADMPHRFSECSRVAMRESPARQCADHQLNNARIVRVAMRGSSADLYNTEDVRGWMRKCKYLNEDEYQLSSPCSHATAEAVSNGQPFWHTHPRITFVRIQLAIILNVCYKQTLGCSCMYAIDDSGSIHRHLWMLWVHVKPL